MFRFYNTKATYLYDLKGFFPNSGINTDNHGKFPFFCYGELTNDETYLTYEVFSRDPEMILSLHSFDTYTLEDEIFKCAEPNLKSIFHPYSKSKILVNHAYEIKVEEKLILKTNFCKGYRAGISTPLTSEVGISFVNMSFAQKLEILEDYINFCTFHSYFEGFGTPDCLFCIGFIQAQLLLALKEKMLVETFIVEATDVNEKVDTNKFKVDVKSLNPQHVPTIISKIKIFSRQNAQDIYNVWLLLLENIPSLKSPIKTEDELTSLLNLMFYCDDFPFSETTSFDTSVFGIVHEDILRLLMRISRGINKKEKNISIKYVDLLIYNFPNVFTESAKTIEGNWKAKSEVTRAQLMKELQESHITIRLSGILQKYNMLKDI